MILTDQHRKDCIGCYGNNIVRTPNIDRIADMGVRFERCYVANPLCMPNRMSLFTGMYPRNHGLWTNGVLLEREQRTLAAELSDNGYQTASFGKIHFTLCYEDYGNMESENFWRQTGDNFDWSGPYWGFEHVELTIGHRLAPPPLAHYGRWFRQRGGTDEMCILHSVSGAGGSGVRHMPPELHESSFIGERTAEFITKERDKTRPFFAVASFPDPHHPFNPPEEYARKYPTDNIIMPTGDAQDLETRPEHYRKHHKPQKPEYTNEKIAHTYAMIELLDHNIGRILEALETEGILEDTIIVFTSDHGELLGDHGLWAKGHYYYEGLLNVGLIIADAGAIKPGTSDALISTVDIFPTIIETLGIAMPVYPNGISFKQVLYENAQTLRDKCLIEFRDGSWNGKTDISSKVIVTRDKKYAIFQNGEEELTDLLKDPDEHLNVVNDEKYHETVQEMRKLLLKEILSTENRFPPQVAKA